MQWTMLASGSGGNASLLEVNGFGLLVDAGLGPRQLAARLASLGASWRHVKAVLLTHTHGDHWNRRTLKYLVRQKVPLYCHRDHCRALADGCRWFADLQAMKLVRTYREDEELVFCAGLRCRPLPLSHDGRPTFGFRFEGGGDLFGHSWALGYAADLGCWDSLLARQLGDVDVLAIEFNHDVAMQKSSGRSPALIARVLGDEGHLSNEQAADLLAQVLAASGAGRIQHLVQLHLSRECNRPALASQAAQAIVSRLGAAVRIHTASQYLPGPAFHLGASPPESASTMPLAS